jgi:bacillithiol biosynthesis cysteine-adding enzyme BshC
MNAQHRTLSFDRTGLLPPLVLDYLAGEEWLRPFHAHRPEAAAFDAIIAARKARPVDRAVLVKALQRQYGDLANDPAARPAGETIRSLGDENTFCVTTGHQLNIFTGPLYFMYKIFSAIHLAHKLAAAHPGLRFVPVYWMASEDHDIDEINHVNLFGKKAAWHPSAGGPAGRLPTGSLAPVLDQVKEIMGDGAEARRLDTLFRACYLESETLAAATRKLVHFLAGKYGLVVVDGDDPALKRLFASVMRDDLTENLPGRLVAGQTEKLGERYAVQVHPRDVNLFLLEPGRRRRIDKNGEGFIAADTGEPLDRETLLQSLDEHPEAFSPNVVLRPLYQETVLPSVAYVGGPAEVSYWLQYKSLFDHYKVPFPAVVLRAMALWINGASAKKLDALGIEPESLFRSEDELVRAYVQEKAGAGASLIEEKETIERLFDGIGRKAAGGDPTLERSVEGEKKKALNQLAALEDKLVRAAKRRHDTAVQQIHGLLEKAFPGGTFQERHDNFIPRFLAQGEAWFECLQEHLDPLAGHLHVFVETGDQ